MTDDQAFDVPMAQAEAHKRGALTIWTIYDRPTDFPEGFIARRFEVAGGEPTPTRDTIVGKLEQLDNAVREAADAFVAKLMELAGI